MNIIDDFSGEYDFLSNFYPCIVCLDGVTAKSVEHLYQAEKATNKSDFLSIINAGTPGKAKRLGRKIEMRSNWNDIKDEIMYDILKIKFSQPDLRDKLLSTGDTFLEEGNLWHDNYWGNCHCEKCINIKGKNTLGKLLMKIRDESK